MFQFSELLTLALGVVTLAYLASNWQRVRGVLPLRCLIAPLLLMAASWLFTVVEGLFLRDALAPIVFAQESVGLSARGGVGVAVCNFLEHLCGALGGIWILVAIIQIYRRRAGRPR